MSLTGAEIARWQDTLLRGGYRPASVNRLCQLLGQAYRLAREQQLLNSSPVIKRLSETGNTRTGIFSPEEFERLLKELPVYLRDFARWAHLTGWRAGSIRSLRWEEVDEDTILCRAQYSKDRTAHRIPLIGPLRASGGGRNPPPGEDRERACLLIPRVSTPLSKQSCSSR